MWQRFILKLTVPTLVLSLALAASIAPAQSPNTAKDKSPPLEMFLTRYKVCPDLSQDEIKAAAQEIADGKRKIPQNLETHRFAWLEYSLHFRSMHSYISIAIIVFGALAAALQDGTAWYTRGKTLAALLATVAAGMNTTLAPYAEFKRFDQAFVVLNTARAQYETNPQVSLCDLGNAVAYGEAIIHKGE